MPGGHQVAQDREPEDRDDDDHHVEPVGVDRLTEQGGRFDPAESVAAAGGVAEDGDDVRHEENEEERRHRQ